MGRLRTNPDAINLIKESKYFLSSPKSKYFKNSNHLFIEIGMGKGIFILQNAINYPNINFIGIEKYPTIVLKAIKKFENYENNLNNLLIINDDAINLNNWFKDKTIDKIFLNFSDPWPKKRHTKKRLTSSSFLNIYKKLLKKNGIIEFKTDNDSLYQFSLEEFSNSKDFKIVNSTNDLYTNEKLNKKNIPTEYEIKFHNAGIKIKKIIARLE